MAKMFVVRHGESTWNAESRWTGQADPPLSPAGRAATEKVAGELDGLAFTGIACSDLRRARQTAEILGRILHLPEPRLLRPLRERDMGSWTGMTKSEIDRRWPGWRDRWREDELLELPNAEHRDAFDARVLSALRELGGEAGPDGRFLVVGHAGTLRAVSRHVAAVGRRGNLAGVWLAVEAGSIRSLAGEPRLRPPP